MGYFSSGTEGAEFEYRYCARCIHGGEQACPIWDLHLVWNYEQCRDGEVAETKAMALDTLIDRGADGLTNRCRFYVRDPERTAPEQLPLFEPARVAARYVEALAEGTDR